MSGVKRVADLRPGDLTSHAGGACTCADPAAPFRVEKLEPWPSGTGIEVTWSHPPCGETFEPLACSPDGFVGFFGASQP